MERKILDGTHPSLAVPEDDTFDSDSVTKYSKSVAENFLLKNGLKGTSNSGPKGVLVDWNVSEKFGQGTASNTGPKSVLKDYYQRKASNRSDAYTLAPHKAASSQNEFFLETEESDDEERDLEVARNSYRAQRKAERSGSQLSGGSHRKIFGKMREITVDTFIQAVEEEQLDVPVCVHLFEPEVEACSVLNIHMQALARAYPFTKFLCIRASDVQFRADEDDDMLPTMMLYKGGEVQEVIVRVDLEWGEGTRKEVDQLLHRYGIVYGHALVNEGIGPRFPSTKYASEEDLGDDDL